MSNQSRISNHRVFKKLLNRTHWPSIGGCGIIIVAVSDSIETIGGTMTGLGSIMTVIVGPFIALTGIRHSLLILIQPPLLSIVLSVCTTAIGLVGLTLPLPTRLASLLDYCSFEIDWQRPL